MRQTTSLSFALLLASGLFSAGGIAAPHGPNDLVQRNTNMNVLDERLVDLGQQPRSPEITNDTGLLKTLKRFVDSVLGRAVSEEEEQAAYDIAARENTVSRNGALDAAPGVRRTRTAMMMGRQFLNETTPDPENETISDPDVVLGRRSPVARPTVLFPRQFINGTTPTNRTVSERAVVLSRDGGSASTPRRRGLVVRTAVVLPRQFTNGTGNGTEFPF